jgi:hypothetical protein
MPLKNRLEEVINRYEKASTLVQHYKDGEINDEELGRGFKRLRRERKEVDDHNRNYIREQRRLIMQEDTSREGADEASVDADAVSDRDNDHDSVDNDDDEANNDDDVDQEEEQGAEDGTVEDPEERRLWRQYGSFWR